MEDALKDTPNEKKLFDHVHARQEACKQRMKPTKNVYFVTLCRISGETMASMKGTDISLKRALNRTLVAPICDEKGQALAKIKGTNNCKTNCLNQFPTSPHEVFPVLLYGPPGTGKSHGIDKALGTITKALEAGGKPSPVFLKLDALDFKGTYHGESEKKAQVKKGS